MSELELSLEQAQSIKLESEEAQYRWGTVIKEDEGLHHRDLFWYSTPGLLWLGSRRKWREQGRIEGWIDPTFHQPAASTSTIRRILVDDGSTRIIKELNPKHQLFYTRTRVAQALTLAGEQALGWLQFGSESDQVGGNRFYLGVFRMQEQDDGRTALSPYDVWDRGRVVGLMREVDRTRTLGILMFSQVSPSTEQLKPIYTDLTRRALAMRMGMLDELVVQFRSKEYLEARIFDHTPGQLSRRGMGWQFDWLRDEAIDYVEKASCLLERDPELLDYLLSEEYARRGGDVRAINTVLDAEGKVQVVLDQINLYIKPGALGAERVSIAPWGMNPPTYEVAFLIPDLLASGNEEVAQTVVDGLGEQVEAFRGAQWEDLGYTPMRALRFWTAMKAIETAGLSTLQIDNPRLGEQEYAYLRRAAERYGGIGVTMVGELLRTTP